MSVFDIIQIILFLVLDILECQPHGECTWGLGWDFCVWLHFVIISRPLLHEDGHKLVRWILLQDALERDELLPCNGHFCAFPPSHRVPAPGGSGSFPGGPAQSLPLPPTSDHESSSFPVLSVFLLKIPTVSLSYPDSTVCNFYKIWNVFKLIIFFRKLYLLVCLQLLFLNPRFTFSSLWKCLWWYPSLTAQMGNSSLRDGSPNAIDTREC